MKKSVLCLALLCSVHAAGDAAFGADYGVVAPPPAHIGPPPVIEAWAPPQLLPDCSERMFPTVMRCIPRQYVLAPDETTRVIVRKPVRPYQDLFQW